jgi:hypothetical protein
VTPISGIFVAQLIERQSDINIIAYVVTLLRIATSVVARGFFAGIVFAGE